MGLINSIVRFLIREHKREPFRGDALVLGRQHLFTTYDGLLDLFAREKLTPQALREGTSTKSNLPTSAAINPEFVSDELFFSLLGIDSLHALDFSPYENADLIHDLNQPVPQSLMGRFDLIIDAGTTEHIFDVRQALANYAAMLKVGGRIFHSSPANNQLNHGFYQLSPGLYFDYYHANGFVDLRGFLVAHGADAESPKPVEFYEYRGDERHPSLLTSETQLSVAFLAKKSAASTNDRVPIQGMYQSLTRGADGAHPSIRAAHDAPASRRIPALVKSLMPAVVKDALRPGWNGVRRRWLKDPSKKPWGLKLWSRI